jgi:hypothetical protein
MGGGGGVMSVGQSMRSLLLTSTRWIRYMCVCVCVCMNLYVSWHDNGRRWRCNVCGAVTEVPSAYFHPLDQVHVCVFVCVCVCIHLPLFFVVFVYVIPTRCINENKNSHTLTHTHTHTHTHTKNRTTNAATSTRAPSFPTARSNSWPRENTWCAPRNPLSICL